MKNGLDEFKALLKDVRSLSFWAVGAGLGAPFIAALLSLAPPPSPKMIGLVSGILELVTLILVFQFFANSPRKRVNRTMRFAAITLCLTALVYLVGFNNYTFVNPAGRRGVAGFTCTSEAKEVYGESCYAKSMQHLAAVEFQASRLWEDWSINLVTNILTTLWLVCFCALSVIIGLFVVFQRRQLPVGQPAQRIARRI